MEVATTDELIAALRTTIEIVENAKILNKDSDAVHDFKRATSKLIAQILLADKTDSSTTTQA